VNQFQRAFPIHNAAGQIIQYKTAADDAAGFDLSKTIIPGLGGAAIGGGLGAAAGHLLPEYEPDGKGGIRKKSRALIGGLLGAGAGGLGGAAAGGMGYLDDLLYPNPKGRTWGEYLWGLPSTIYARASGLPEDTEYLRKGSGRVVDRAVEGGMNIIGGVGESLLQLLGIPVTAAKDGGNRFVDSVDKWSRRPGYTRAGEGLAWAFPSLFGYKGGSMDVLNNQEMKLAMFIMPNLTKRTIMNNLQMQKVAGVILAARESKFRKQANDAKDKTQNKGTGGKEIANDAAGAAKQTAETVKGFPGYALDVADAGWRKIKENPGTTAGAGIGAALGGVGGGLAGYHSGGENKKTKRRRALIGALAGTLGGGAIGGLGARYLGSGGKKESSYSTDANIQKLASAILVAQERKFRKQAGTEGQPTNWGEILAGAGIGAVGGGLIQGAVGAGAGALRGALLHDGTEAEIGPDGQVRKRSRGKSALRGLIANGIIHGGAGALVGGTGGGLAGAAKGQFDQAMQNLQNLPK
jgi:hypothetical protein